MNNNDFNALNTNILTVDGETGIDRYPVTRGWQIIAFDQYSDRFWIKSVDMSGKPLPIREFEYQEKVRETPEEANNNKIFGLLEEIKNQLTETNDRVSKLEQRNHNNNKHNKPNNQKE